MNMALTCNRVITLHIQTNVEYYIMVQQSRILIGPFHFEIADNEAWEQ